MIFQWLTSDTHFGHVNILDYEPIRKTWCDGTVEGMTDALIMAWQRVVSPSDHVLHLGDFFMGSRVQWPAIRVRLPGRITLVRGNHDPKPGSALWNAFQPMTVVDSLAFKDPRFGRIICRHNPADFTEAEAEEFDILLHGHLHSGHHRADVPEAIRAKCRCASVERLPSQPAPLAFERLGELKTSEAHP